MIQDSIGISHSQGIIIGEFAHWIELDLESGHWLVFWVHLTNPAELAY
jgi:hypothetical protein